MTTQIQDNMPVVGVEDLHFSRQIEGGYDTPVLFKGIKQIGIKNKIQDVPIYGDNKLLHKMSKVDCVEITITTNDMTDTEEAYLLGHQLAEDGGIIYMDTDKAPNVGMKLKSPKARGGDRYMTFYNGIFEPYDEDIKGQEGKITPTYKKLKATFMPLSNGLYKHKFDTDSPGVTQEKIDNFFKEFCIPTPKKETVVKEEKVSE